MYLSIFTYTIDYKLMNIFHIFFHIYIHILQPANLAYSADHLPTMPTTRTKNLESLFYID